MNRLIYILLAVALCSCTDKAKQEREAQAKVEREMKAHALQYEQETQEIDHLIRTAAGVASETKEERKLAYVKLQQKFPQLNDDWEAMLEAINRDEFYSEFREISVKVEKIRGQNNDK